MDNKDKKKLTIVRDLAVTPKEFFDHLLDDFIQINNANKSGAKQLKREDVVKGLKVTNGKTDKYKKAEYIIDEIVKNQTLQVTCRSFNLNGFTRYTLEKSEKGVKVTLTETVPDSIRETKGKFLQGFGEMICLSRMSRALMDWEREQIMARENTIQPPSPLDLTKKIYGFFTKLTKKKNVLEDED